MFASSTLSAPECLRALQQELRRIAVAGLVLLLAAALGFAVALGPGFALGWVLAGLGCWGFVLWHCQKRLPRNRSAEDAAWLTTLGTATHVTLLRGLLIAATAGFLTTPLSSASPILLTIPAVLYTLAAIGDALDGYLARRLRQTTLLGAELDMVLDALGLLIAPLLAILTGKLHVSYLLVSLAYYAFQGGIHWRRRHDRPVYPLPPSRLRRQLAGWQMVVVAAALWPPLPAALTQPLGVLFMTPLLIGFCRDWLAVSGRLGASRHTSL